MLNETNRKGTELLAEARSESAAISKTQRAFSPALATKIHDYNLERCAEFSVTPKFDASVLVEHRMYEHLLKIKDESAGIEFVRGIASELRSRGNVVIENEAIHTKHVCADFSMCLTRQLAAEFATYLPFLGDIQISTTHKIGGKRVRGLIVLKLCVQPIPWVTHVGNIGTVSIDKVISERALERVPVCFNVPFPSPRENLVEFWTLPNSARAVSTRGGRHEAELYMTIYGEEAPLPLAVKSIAKFVKGKLAGTLFSPQAEDTDTKFFANTGKKVPATTLTQTTKAGRWRLKLHLGHITKGTHRTNVVLIFHLGEGETKKVFWFPLKRKNNDAKRNYIQVRFLKTDQVAPKNAVPAIVDLPAPPTSEEDGASGGDDLMKVDGEVPIVGEAAPGNQSGPVDLNAPRTGEKRKKAPNAVVGDCKRLKTSHRRSGERMSGWCYRPQPVGIPYCPPAMPYGYSYPYPMYMAPMDMAMATQFNPYCSVAPKRLQPIVEIDPFAEDLPLGNSPPKRLFRPVVKMEMDLGIDIGLDEEQDDFVVPVRRKSRSRVSRKSPPASSAPPSVPIPIPVPVPSPAYAMRQPPTPAAPEFPFGDVKVKVEPIDELPDTSFADEYLSPSPGSYTHSSFDGVEGDAAEVGFVEDDEGMFFM